jgi:hypothetical protein
MSKNTNPGFDPVEIAALKKQCQEDNRSFVYILDEELPSGNEREMVHIQFVGQYEKQEVIYDAIVCTLQLHYSSLLYEAAEREIIQQYPLYVPLENRDENYEPNEELDEEVEMLILEVIEDLEENEEIKVAEYIEIDPEFDYGVSIEVALYVTALDDDMLTQFIIDFNGNTLSLDPSLYTFNSDDEEDEEDED